VSDDPAPKAGRPSVYKPEYAEQARKLCLLLGATDKDLAKFFEVDEKTIVRWRHAREDFGAAVEQGKMAADANVAERLYVRAVGYEHEAVKIFMPAGAKAPVYAPYTERFPPDVPAQSLWLRNRRPAEWRDRVEHTGDKGGPIVSEVRYRWADETKDEPPKPE